MIKWNQSIEVLTKLVEESLLSHSLNLPSQYLRQVAEVLVDSVSHNYLLLFVVLTHKMTTVSRYAECHNQIVDYLLLNDQIDTLVEEAKLGIDVMHEVVDDCLLCQNEKDEVLSALNFNYQTLLTLISNYQSQLHQNCAKLIDMPPDPNAQVSATDSETLRCQNLFTECQKALRSFKDQVPGVQPSLVRIIDRPSGKLLPSVYFFKKEDLQDLKLKFQTSDVPINCHSKMPFHPTTEKTLRRYFCHN